jgi:hypothetical protein
MLPTLSAEFPWPPNCTPANQALFMRSDSLDNFNYVDQLSSKAVSPDSSSNGQSDGQSPNAAAKGASLSYTDNRNAATQTAAINARISYLLIGRVQCKPAEIAPGYTGDITRPFIRGFAFAPFVSSDGTWNEPFATTTTATKITGNKSSTGETSTTTVSSAAKTVTMTTTSKVTKQG